MESQSLAPRTLRSIMYEWDAVIAEIEENDGELSSELESRMKTLELEIPEKIDNYGYFLEQAELQIEYRKKRSEAEYALRMRWEKAVEYVKNHLKGHMFERGEKKKKGNEFTFTAVDSRPKVAVFDEHIVHPKYFKERIVYELDKDALRADLEAGVEIPGVRLEKVTALRRSRAQAKEQRIEKKKDEKILTKGDQNE